MANSCKTWPAHALQKDVISTHNVTGQSSFEPCPVLTQCLKIVGLMSSLNGYILFGVVVLI